MESRPSKPFKYPGDRPMCAHGQIRAAEYARQILSGEASAEQIEAMARRGEYALNRGADTHKKNLIAHVVYFLFARGQLLNYANEQGDFVTNSGDLANLSKYDKIASRFRG